MTARGSLDDVVRRLEANLKTPRRVDIPKLGAVELGESVYVRRDLGEAALSATLEAEKGLVFKSRCQVSVELASLADLGAPASVERLKGPIGWCEHRVRNRLDLHAVLAVFSASGWQEEAVAYARNDPPGSGYAGGRVHLVLVGPAATDVVTCGHDEVARALRPVLRGRTEDEEEAVAREAIERALTLDDYAVLDRVASGGGLDPACVERAAREMASRDEALRIEKLRGAGRVLRRRR